MSRIHIGIGKPLLTKQNSINGHLIFFLMFVASSGLVIRTLLYLQAIMSGYTSPEEEEKKNNQPNSITPRAASVKQFPQSEGLLI